MRRLITKTTDCSNGTTLKSRQLPDETERTSVVAALVLSPCSLAAMNIHVYVVDKYYYLSFLKEDTMRKQSQYEIKNDEGNNQTSHFTPLSYSTTCVVYSAINGFGREDEEIGRGK